MCIYTVKKQNLQKLLILKGVRNSTERLKIRRLLRKGYRKTNKDWGMSCCI